MCEHPGALDAESVRNEHLSVEARCIHTCAQEARLTGGDGLSDRHGTA
jgi:hypothetical protein